MLDVSASVNVQFIFAPLLRLLLVCLFTHDPVSFVANVALILWLVSRSFTVAPTAICSSWSVLPLVGCSPVIVGLVFVVV